MLSEEVTFRLFLLLVLIANHIATPFDLRAHFLRLFQDCRLLMREGSQITRTTLSIYHGNVYHRLRHFRNYVEQVTSSRRSAPIEVLADLVTQHGESSSFPFHV